MDVFVARQPIFDSNQQVIAYELLYRTSEKNFFDGSVSSNVATSILLMNSYFSFGLENLIGQEKAFINFDKHLIDADIPKLLDKDSVVIELLEDIVPDTAFIEKIKELKSLGYTIALDDYVKGYGYDELTKIVDIIKVDFFENTQTEIAQIARRWRIAGKKLLAEKVETKEVYEWSKKLGFDYFQGYFFEKPSVVKGKKIDDHAFQYVQLMEELSKAEPDNRNIAKIIETDATLTYKLLKLVNNGYSLKSSVNSITHALAILGSKAFEKWLSLAMVQNLNANKPSAIIKTAMVRSALMEKIANASRFKSKHEEISLIGVLSVLDVMLDKTMEEVVESLPLNRDIKQTLLLKDSPYLPIYQITLAYEKGQFEDISKWCPDIDFNCSTLPEAYVASVKWSEILFDVMQA